MGKTLKERNCYMVIEPNLKIERVWNGYLVKNGNVFWRDGYIKAFLYATPEECFDAATAWANANPRSLKNYKEKEVKIVEETIEICPEELDMDLQGIEDEISEKISDITGYCHDGFSYTIVVTAQLDKSE